MNKEKLIGGTVPKVGGGNHQVDAKTILEKDFESSDSVAYMFCEGCETYFELSESGAKDLGDRVGEQLSQDSEYFHTRSCTECGGYDGYVEVKKVLLN